MYRLTLAASALVLSGCWFGDDTKVISLSGKTMGTTYNITAIGPDLDADTLGPSVEATLKAVNASMSNWDPNSEVSRFSGSSSTEPVSISAAFSTVMQAAAEVHAGSDGRFDVTLGPLIELWGFGPREPQDPVPAERDIAAALAQVGQTRLLSLDTDAATLAKSAPEVGVNLSAIAKGYGVDAVAQTLLDAGATDYMVEIGGDLVTKGKNAEGEIWRIGIEKPETGSASIQMVLPLSDLGLATSGDYRNFFEHEGRRYSHILDATTGRPITHNTTSVTVIAPSAMLADAWATAMLVLGQEAGLKLADAQGLAVFFIERDVTSDTEGYITAQSRAFSALQTKE